MIMQANLTSELVRFYMNRKMTERLADSILVCRWVETLLADLPETETARIKPVFDYPEQQLKQDWLRCRYFDLWLDSTTGRVVDYLPPSEGDIDLWHQHLPLDTQATILFGRFAPMFK